MVWYITLLCCGLFLIGAEVFVPGGILGLFGAAALIGAAVIGFRIFPPLAGWLSLFFILLMSGLAVYAWMRFLPASPVGKALALAQNITGKDRDDSPWKPGMQGVTQSALRPAGVAMIENRRVDVIARGTWIDAQTPVKIVKVEGNRVYVDTIPRPG